MELQILNRLNKSSQEALKRPYADLNVYNQSFELDEKKLWLPESASHFFGAPFFNELHPEERLTYNHLFAITTLQQFIFFEKEFAHRMVKLLCPDDKKPSSVEGKTMESAITHFGHEEAEHIRMFSEFIKKTQKKYPNVHLFKSGFVSQFVLDKVFENPELFAFWTWVVIFAEERTTTLPKRMLREPEKYDSISFQIQERHLKDEMRHMVFVEEILKDHWDPLPRWKKVANIHLVQLFFSQVFYRSYSASQTWKQLVVIHPRLSSMNSEVELYLDQLPQNREYLQQLFSDQSCPNFWRLLRERPETMSLQEDILRRIS